VQLLVTKQHAGGATVQLRARDWQTLAAGLPLGPPSVPLGTRQAMAAKITAALAGAPDWAKPIRMTVTPDELALVRAVAEDRAAAG
jgi:hypothetical protein